MNPRNTPQSSSFRDPRGFGGRTSGTPSNHEVSILALLRRGNLVPEKADACLAKQSSFSLPEPRPPCPRCASTRVVRWGRFSGRKRFRCRACNRTFSDLTETVLARTRSLPKWLKYLQAFEREFSLRRAAEFSGVSLSTAFRWRHKVLAQASKHQTPFPFSGQAGFAFTRYPPLRFLVGRGVKFPTSSRNEFTRSNGEGGGWHPSPHPISSRWLIAIHGRIRPKGPNEIRLISVQAPSRNLCTGSWAALLKANTSPRCRILPPSGICSPFMTALGQVRRKNGRDRPTKRASQIRESGDHLRSREKPDGLARSRLFEFTKWMRKFRGTADRYLNHYLAWFVIRSADPSGRLRPRDLGRRGRSGMLDRLWQFAMNRPGPKVAKDQHKLRTESHAI